MTSPAELTGLGIDVSHVVHVGERSRFQINIDINRDLLHATLEGFFSVQEVALFARAEQKAVTTLHCITGEHRLIIDVTRCQIQPREVAAAFAYFAAAPPVKARRIAVIATASLHRMQARRILEAACSATFRTVVEAENWIDADEQSNDARPSVR